MSYLCDVCEFNTPDRSNLKIVCTDLARRMFTWKDAEGNTIIDVKLHRLIGYYKTIYREPIHSITCILESRKENDPNMNERIRIFKGCKAIALDNKREFNTFMAEKTYKV